MKKELNMLNLHECEIINKLRTEHINLNDYKYHRFKKEESPKCKFCKTVNETVEHYLIDCPGQTNQMGLDMNPWDRNYNILRNLLKYRLKKQCVFFKQKQNFTVQNLLFPHIWQVNPLKEDKYKIEKKKKNLLRQVYVLKKVIEFVKSTKRFNKEMYGI